ncbi:MAG: PKD domain-containing protein, partial [Rhodothermales bacterium]
LFAILLFQDAGAQGYRPEDTFFLKPRVGVAWFLGDTEMSPFNFNMDNWKVDEEPPPLAAGLEFGYQYSQTTSVSLGWQISNHPLFEFYGATVPAGLTDPAGWFNSGQLLLRLAAPSRVAPFIALGAHITDGQDGRTSLMFGPTIGLGLDIVVSDRMSLVLENLSNFTFPDDGFDLVDENQFGDDFMPFDLVNTLTLGLKINFKSAFIPVEILSVNCPSGTIETGESATLSASVNANATQPVSVTWNFGDGTSATGMTAMHSWSRGGTYTVTVTADNGRATDSESCTVTVRGPAPAEIVSIDASETRFQVCEPVEVDFEANVRGDEPITLRWDFGDGTTGTGREVSHTYSEPGTYTVTLTATNDAGTQTRTLTITAEECVAAICLEITEMNSVFFARNSSTLTDEARAALRENIEIFEQCPNLCAEIVGYAGADERNAQALSEDRARAVEQFYVDNGIARSRFSTEGRGILAGTTKKEGAAQARRVDTIPVQCVDLDR